MSLTKRIFLIFLATSTGFMISNTIGCEGDPPQVPPDDPIISTDDDDVSDDDDAVIENSLVSGHVRDPMAQPLHGVRVSIGDQSTLTNFDGHFGLPVDLVEERVLVNFRLDGYARVQTPLSVEALGNNTVMQVMAPVDFVGTFNAEDGLEVLVEEGGPTVGLPAGSYVDVDGNPYTGVVHVEATSYDLLSAIDAGGELLATPGDFSATSADGAQGHLESFGMFQVNLMDDAGSGLQVPSPAPVVLPVQTRGSSDTPVVGDVVPAWSYDEVLGTWIEGPSGTVIDVEGVLSYQFDAPHFSTWNCDRPIQTHGCLTGTVVDSSEEPRSGATVRAVGVTYISTTTARTGQDGDFCLEVKNGETVWTEISYSIAGQAATQRTDPITISPGTASCSLGAETCDDLGVVTVDIQTCVSGIVIDSQGQPRPDMQVLSTVGGIATTDSGGAFCLTTPVFQSADIHVVGQFGDALYQPVSIYTQPGLPNCQGGCSNLAILRPYVDTTCIHGDVQINGSAEESIPVEVYDLNFPSARVSSTLTSTNGSFCAEAPSNTNISVRLGGTSEPCAEQLVSTEGLGGEACGDSGQFGECSYVGTLSCNL